MILTREAAGQRIHRRTVLEYALESQSQSASVTVSELYNCLDKTEQKYLNSTGSLPKEI